MIICSGNKHQQLMNKKSYAIPFHGHLIFSLCLAEQFFSSFLFFKLLTLGLGTNFGKARTLLLGNWRCTVINNMVEVQYLVLKKTVPDPVSDRLL